MSPPSVIIIGAGLAGLTLGRCLLSRGIQAIILEKRHQSQKRHGYSIALSDSSREILLKQCHLKAQDLPVLNSHPLLSRSKNRNEDPNKSDSGTECQLRYHLGNLESLLCQDLNICWEHEVEDVSTKGEKVEVDIKSKSSMETATLVAADGVHSRTRRTMAPEVSLQVHPYVAFYGTRQVPLDSFDKVFAPELQSLGIITSMHHDILLRVFVNYCTETNVGLGYTFSRRARNHDLLHKPNRSKSEASMTPSSFYDELDSLSGLSTALKETFDPQKVRQDRVLHWLMRSAFPDRRQTQDLADQRVLLLGDALHATPILGSEGADLAVQEACALAEWITKNGTQSLRAYVDSAYTPWAEAVERGVHKLETMHDGSRAAL